MATTCRYEFQLKLFGFADAKPEDFYTSRWFASKTAFVCYRAFMFVYCLLWSIMTTLHLVKHYPYYCIYLSNWGEWSLVVYFGISLAVAIYGLARDHHPDSVEDGGCSGKSCLNDDLRWFHRLSWVVCNATTGVAYLITIIYWALLNDLPVTSTAVNVHQHIMNSVLMTIDLFMSRVPVRLLHFIYLTLYGLTYTLFTLILHAANVRSFFYPDILDWESAPGVSAGVTLGLSFIGSPIIHAVIFGLYHLRAFIARNTTCGQDSEDVQVDQVEPQFRGERNFAFEMAAPNGSA